MRLQAIFFRYFRSVCFFLSPSVILDEFDFNLFDYYISVFSFWWLLGLSSIKIENEHSQSGGKMNEKSLELLSNKTKKKKKKTFGAYCKWIYWFTMTQLHWNVLTRIVVCVCVRA